MMSSYSTSFFVGFWGMVFGSVLMAQASNQNQATAPQPPGFYVDATFGEWDKRCVDLDPSLGKNCILYQLARDASGVPTAEFRITKLPKGSPEVALATALVPLQTLLEARLGYRVDDDLERRYPFEWCELQGCVVRIGLSQGDVDRLVAGDGLFLRCLLYTSDAADD